MKKTRIVIILLFLLVLISGVQASSLQFIDAAGIGNGTLQITMPGNEKIGELNSTEMIEVHNGTAYLLKYQPRGMVQVKDETGVTLNGVRFLLSYYSDFEHFANLMVTLLCLIILLLGVTGKL